MTLTEQPAQPGGAGAAAAGLATARQLPAIQIGPATDVLRTVESVRNLNGLDVYGPNSILSVGVGAGGVAGGELTLRGVGNPVRPTDIISRGDAAKRFLADFPYPVTVEDDDGTREDESGGTSVSTMAVAGGGLTGQLQSVRVIYYEPGGRSVQPAYLFRVLLQGPTGARTGLVRLVPAVLGTPEPILDRPVLDLPPRIGPVAATPQLPPACVVPDAIRFGRDLLRDDDARWLRDARGFGAEIEASNPLARLLLSEPFPPTNDAQCFWNHTSLWVPTGAPPTDQSPSFPGSVHVALIEGHGLTWRISTEKNCCDVISLTPITGFGGHHSPAELTDSVISQSCSVVAAPRDPYGGSYGSPASPFDVWFTIFPGLRGTYGYRTETNIWNRVGMAFASDLGVGVQNLSAWFTECNNNVFNHGGGRNYGSAALISGSEGETPYDPCALAPPGSLTIWWQHP